MATSTQGLQPIDKVIVPHPVTLELYRKMVAGLRLGAEKALAF